MAVVNYPRLSQAKATPTMFMVKQKIVCPNAKINGTSGADLSFINTVISASYLDEKTIYNAITSYHFLHVLNCDL